MQEKCLKFGTSFLNPEQIGLILPILGYAHKLWLLDIWSLWSTS